MGKNICLYYTFVSQKLRDVKMIWLEGHYPHHLRTNGNKLEVFSTKFHMYTRTHRHLKCNLSIISYHLLIHQISALVSEGQLNEYCSVYPPQVSVVGACIANNKCFTLQRVWLCKTTSHCAYIKRQFIVDIIEEVFSLMVWRNLCDSSI